MQLIKLQILSVLLFVFQFSRAQDTSIAYGNNPSAGKYLNIRGFKMYMEMYGTGMPILMIPGNGGTIAAFAKTIPYFQRKYRVIVADSRAQGKSLDLHDSLSFEMMADDYAVLLDSLHITKAYILGWSDGAINGLLLACRHPEKVIKMALTGTNLWPDSSAINPTVWMDEQKSYTAFKAEAWTNDDQKTKWKLFLLDWNSPHIPLSLLQIIHCPTLIISGDHDVINLYHTVLIYQHIQQALLWILPNSGHATLIEHADEFNIKVDTFFNLGIVKQTIK